jgi:hypothetical protein
MERLIDKEEHTQRFYKSGKEGGMRATCVAEDRWAVLRAYGYVSFTLC